MAGAAILIAMWIGPVPIDAQQETERGIRTVPKAVESTAEPTGPPASLITGRFRALVIGNDNYSGKKWPALKTAVRDAEELALVLQRSYGFPEDAILLKRNATRREIVRAFTTLAETAQPDDSVFIYYAGHGEYDELERGYWVPVDAQDRADYVSNDEILGWLRSIKARHRLLVADSCFSGNMLTRASKDAPTDRSLPSRYVIEKTKLISVQGFTSGGNEPVSDGGTRWNGHSIFAYHLIAQLKANQRPYLSAQWLGYQVAELVANDTASALGQGQTPVFSPIPNQGHQGGDFFFHASGNLGKPALIVVVSNGAPGFADASSKARLIVAGRLRENLEALGIPTAAEVTNVAPNASPEAVLGLLQEQQAERAVVVRVHGELKPQRSAMWEGISTMDIELEAYRVQDKSVVSLGTHRSAAQALPMRNWSEDASVLEIQFEKNAEKLVGRSMQGDLTLLLDQLRD